MNGQMEVDRRRMVWELRGRSSVEHAAKWVRDSAVRKLESAQMSIGWRLLGASNTVAEVAMQGDPGWRKPENRREEMKILFGREWKGWKRVDWWRWW